MRGRAGFTLVELSLAMVFISILSLAVVLVITGAISSYHKSITMNQVDQVGSEIVDDMTLAVQAGPSRAITNLCADLYTGGAQNECTMNFGKMVSVTRNAKVKQKSNNTYISEAAVPVYGGFCTGAYSYVWSSGYYFNDAYQVEGAAEPATVKYMMQEGGAVTKTGVRLLKILDEDRAVCAVAMKLKNGRLENSYDASSIGNVFDLTVVGLVRSGETVALKEEPEELLADENDGGLALYNLVATVAGQKDTARNVFYYASFILGTVQGGVNINGTGNFCQPPEGYNNTELANFDYCAINKFNFAAMANGG